MPVKGIIKSTIYQQFCGGETIKECNDTIAKLGKYNIGAILDYSVEGKEKESDFEHTKTETIDTVKKAKGDERIPFSVFKVTGMARFALLEKRSAGSALNPSDEAEWEKVVNRIDEICGLAHSIKQQVFIDAEESWIQNAIDEIAEIMMERYNKETALIFNTVQLYRHDRLDYLKAIHQKSLKKGYFLAVKLVRGAYMEKERARAELKGYKSPIQASKAHTDHDFDAAVDFCLDHVESISFCAGTHNELSNKLLVEKMDLKNIDPKHPHVHFSQLYGMSDNLSFNLSNGNYNVTKYVPYGPVKDVLPYLIRRAQENTAMAGQMSRELQLIHNEIKRRKIND